MVQALGMSQLGMEAMAWRVKAKATNKTMILVMVLLLH